MRNRALMMTAALALASSMAAAQTPSPNPAPAPGPTAPTVGTIDFGAYVGGTDGDGARFERYRDTRDGVYSDFTFNKQTTTYFADLSANHLGYRDQRIALDYARRWGTLAFLFDSTPTNYLYGATTPYTRGTTLTLPDNLQADVQARRVSGVPCAYATACTSPTTAAAALANRSIYNTALSAFDLQSKRETVGLNGLFSATRDLGITLAFTSTKKGGEMPWAGSHAFNNVNGFPVTLDHRTNDFSTGVEWSRPKGMVRIGWDGSFFSNSNQTLVWDNPIRASDFTNGTAIPWDGNGYSNGNGAAQGRMALWPNSTQHVISGTGMYKLAKRTNINGTLQFTNQSQNEQLIPWTINSVINNAVSGTLFPALRQLPRDTAEAKVSGVHALLNLTTRPMRYLSLQARYRYNDRDVKTPTFDGREYVRFDAVPEDVEEALSHQYDITRQNFDAAAIFTLRQYGALKAGYGHEAFERHGRGFSDVGENIVRLSYDVTNLGFLTLRAGFDVGRRRGEGFVEQGIDYESGPGGTQPGLRYYDESDRDRTRASLSLAANPNDVFSVYVQFASGKDEYLSDGSVPVGREFFGLLDAEVTTWNVGVSATPNDTTSMGLSFGRDDFSALQSSRNANPAPDPSWSDPNRNWTLDNDEQVDNFNLWLELADVAGAAVRLDYDFSNSDNAFIHGGPRIATLAATAPGLFVALPNVTNTWHRLGADVKYFFTRNVGVGIGYYYEKLDIEDFATIDTNGSVGFTAATGAPRIDYLGALFTGYGSRPYDGQNVFVRLLYRF